MNLAAAMVRAMFWSRFQGRRCDAGVAPCSIGMVALKMGPRTLHLEPRGGVAFLPAQVTLAGGENNQTFPETGRADRTDQGKEDMVEAASMCKGEIGTTASPNHTKPTGKTGHLSSLISRSSLIPPASKHLTPPDKKEVQNLL